MSDVSPLLTSKAAALIPWPGRGALRSHGHRCEHNATRSVPFHNVVMIVAQDPLLALAAARTYLTLVSVPGNVSVLSPVALRASLNILKCWAKACAKRKCRATRKYQLHERVVQVLALSLSPRTCLRPPPRQCHWRRCGIVCRAEAANNMS